MNNTSHLQENLSMAKRIKKPTEQKKSKRPSSSGKKTKTKKKKATPTKISKSNQKSKKLAFESTQSPTIGMGLYKKVFVEQFETKSSNSKPIANKSFDTCYLSKVNSSRNRQEHIEKEQFSQFLKDMETFEQTRLLDQTSRIFHAIVQYQVQNPLAFDKLDSSKIVDKISCLNVKIDEFKKILQKWDLISAQSQKNATKQKKVETLGFNDLNQFSRRLELYEKLKAGSKGFSEANFVQNLEKMKAQEALSLKMSKNNTEMNIETEENSALGTNDTFSERSVTEKRRYSAKEEQPAEVEVLCAEIDEIFSSDNNLLYRVLDHIKNSNAKHQLDFQTEDMKSYPLLKDLINEEEKQHEGRSKWNIHKNNIKRSEESTNQKKNAELEELYKFEVPAKKSVVQKALLPAVNMIAKSSEETKCNAKDNQITLKLRIEDIPFEGLLNKNSSASNKENKKAKTPENIKIPSNSVESKSRDNQMEITQEPDDTSPIPSVDHSFMIERPEIRRKNLNQRLVNLASEANNYSHVSQSFPHASTTCSQSTLNYGLEDEEVAQSPEPFFKCNGNQIMGQEIDQGYYGDVEMPSDQNIQIPAYNLQEELQQQQHLSQPIVFEPQEPSISPDFYPNQYNTIELNFGDCYAQANGQQPMFLQIPIIPDSQQIFSITSSENSIVIQMLPNNYIERPMPEVKFVQHHPVLPQSNYIVPQPNYVVPQPNYVVPHQYLPNSTIKFQQQQYDMPDVPAENWSYHPGYTQQNFHQQFNHTLPPPTGVSVSNRAQRVRTEDNFCPHKQQPLPKYTNQHNQNHQEYIHGQPVYYPASNPAGYSHPTHAIPHKHSKKNQRFAPTFAKYQ